MKKRILNGKLLPKFLAIIMAAGMLSLGVHANDVYIEQIGENSIILITQQGASNLVNGNVGGAGANDDMALIKGDLNNVNISQIGVNNTLSIVVNNDANGSGATVVVSADGSDNIQTIGCGTALSSSCNASIIKSEILGDSNITVQTLSGGVIKSTISIVGDYNNVSHTASGAGLHSGEITVTGSGTNGAPSGVILTQSGVSTKNAVITSNGASNSITITQSDL